MALEIHGVTHAFGDRTALDAVSVTVTRGVLTGLLGPNGAGKTTLLRVILGVLTPEAGRIVLFSSHQLDLVQDLCEVIAMIDQGRTVLEGSVATLRASSGERQLRLHVTGTTRAWLDGLPGVIMVSDQADDLRLAIGPGVDPLEALDAARVAGTVSDFGLELPTLSQLFLSAAGQAADGERAA